MSKPKIMTTPNFTIDSPSHTKIADNNELFTLWQRNVVDRFKEKSNEEIRQELRATAQPFAVCFESWRGDFNIATGVRNANGFNVKEVFYIGQKSLDRRGMMGVQNYTNITWLSSMEELLELKNKYVFVGVDNVPGSIPMENYTYADNSLLIFGEESCGLTPTIQSLCKDIIHINMKGSVRSFNCGTASGIAMYDISKKLAELKK